MLSWVIEIESDPFSIIRSEQDYIIIAVPNESKISTEAKGTFQNAHWEWSL